MEKMITEIHGWCYVLGYGVKLCEKFTTRMEHGDTQTWIWTRFDVGRCSQIESLQSHIFFPTSLLIPARSLSTFSIQLIDTGAMQSTRCFHNPTLLEVAINVLQLKWALMLHLRSPVCDLLLRFVVLVIPCSPRDTPFFNCSHRSRAWKSRTNESSLCKSVSPRFLCRI